MKYVDNMILNGDSEAQVMYEAGPLIDFTMASVIKKKNEVIEPIQRALQKPIGSIQSKVLRETSDGITAKWHQYLVRYIRNNVQHRVFLYIYDELGYSGKTTIMKALLKYDPQSYVSIKWGKDRKEMEKELVEKCKDILKTLKVIFIDAPR